MKIRHRLNRNGGILLLALGFTAVATAALNPNEWRHRQALHVPTAGPVHVNLTAASFDTAGPQQADFRIIDATNREVAFLLDRPTAPSPQIIDPFSFTTQIVSQTTIITITPGVEEGIASITLETPHPFFLRAARLEISRNGDGSDWTPIGSPGMPLFRQFGAEQLTLHQSVGNAALVRIIIDNLGGPPIPFTGARLTRFARPAPALVPIGARLTGREEFAGETVLTLALDGRHVPLAALEFATDDPLFMRCVTVTVREVHDTISRERTIGSGTIYRVALDGADPRAQLTLPLAFTPATRELLVHIHNGDSPPLAIDHVRVLRQPVELWFMAPAAGEYTLLSGNTQVAAPRYDLAAFAGDLRAAQAVRVTPGELTDTENYHPRDSLTSPSLPDVPLVGAPLDTADWTHHRAIEITQPGVQELELDPAALARAQNGFADLRVMHAGNQIPFVLERPDLARALTVNAVEISDPKRLSVSVWQLSLPQAGLPVRSLRLASTTPLFQRQFRLFEKLTDPNGHPYENQLAAGSWSRKPEPGTPESRVFEFNTRPQTDTLWIETANGDNPAIELGPVQLIHPVIRLIFTAEGTDGYTLAYGNLRVSAPRYDLSLIAEQLLTASRQPAQLSAAAESSVRRNPFAILSGGYVFWGVLALVVIGLLAIVAKLLPKPPAGKNS